MAKKKEWLSYEVASKAAKEAGCKSRKQFMEWHVRCKIKNIPKQPNRVYSEWDGWPAFLETGNVFAADRDNQEYYRKYWESVRWAQAWCAKNNIMSGQGWKHAYSADKETGRNEIPDDIPKHPENFYKDDWSGWPVWLGKDVQEKLIAAKQEVALLCLATAQYRASNIISVIVAKDGESSLVDMLYQKSVQPLRIFRFDKQLGKEIQQILESCSTLQPDGAWICRNVHQLIGELTHILELYSPVNIAAFKKLAEPAAAPDYGIELGGADFAEGPQLGNGRSDFI
jgi:hypothetical protein